jgi:cytochrome c biogenesis protein CcmG, thiol:disulfide interchange protein DsbE
MILSPKSMLILFLSLSAFGAGWIVITPKITGQSTQVINAAPQIGFSAPEVELQTFEGRSLKLSDLQGQVVVLNFWASWCPPCRQEMPAFQAASAKYADSKVVFIGINNTTSDTTDAAQGLLDQLQIKFTNLIDSDNSAMQAYQIRSLPTTFFINPDGFIEELYIGGPIPQALLDSTLQRMLQESR